MVSSLDGFIDKKDRSVDWMRSTDEYEKGLELTDEIIQQFLAGIDCYLMGSKTYERAVELGWPYGDTPVVVLTKRDLHSNRPSVRFYSGDLKALVQELKSQYKGIWMVGGSQLTKECLNNKLADGIVLSILPIILGDGLLFFDFIGQEIHLHLKDATAYRDGMVELSYDIID